MSDNVYEKLLKLMETKNDIKKEDIEKCLENTPFYNHAIGIYYELKGINTDDLKTAKTHIFTSVACLFIFLVQSITDHSYLISLGFSLLMLIYFKEKLNQKRQNLKQNIKRKIEEFMARVNKPIEKEINVEVCS